MLKLNYLFCDGMILQRDREVAIWGESDSSVKITIDDICVKGEAINGTFSVKIPQHICGGPYVLKIENETDCISINDVYYGDVYLASGQSNMYLSIADTNQKLDECENIVKRIGELVGTEFEYNTNPLLFSNYDPRYSYCLFKNDQPIAFSLIETVGNMAVFHLLSRAKHSVSGAFLLPLFQTFTDLLADSFWKISFVVYHDNDRMRALSDNDFITQYVDKVQPFKVYSKKTFLHPH